MQQEQKQHQCHPTQSMFFEKNKFPDEAAYEEAVIFSAILM